MTALFRLGDFTLAGGQRSTWKLDCDALTDDDWRCLAAMLAERVPPFGLVYGVPTGGYPLATALDRHVTTSSDLVLVADDVYTTGGSLERFIDSRIRPAHPDAALHRAVVFARNDPPAGWGTVLVSVH